MRALCGAIIAAGAMIGLGLTSMGIGTRYSAHPYLDKVGDPEWVKFKNLDTSLMFNMVFLAIAAAIGLGLTFLGLAYHHHRRHHEFLREQERHNTRDRVSV